MGPHISYRNLLVRGGYMPRRFVIPLLAAIALLTVVGVAASATTDHRWAAGSSMDPSMDMRYGHIDVANKDRLDYYKTYVAGVNVTEIKMYILKLDPYLKIVPVAGFKTFKDDIGTYMVSHKIPVRNVKGPPTFTVVLKVAANIPLHKAFCIQTALLGSGPDWQDPKPQPQGLGGYCRTGKGWLHPLVPPK